MVLSTYNEGNIDCGDVQVRVIPHGETLIKSVGNVEHVCQLSLILVPGEVPLDTTLAVGEDTHAHAERIITPVCTHYAHSLVPRPPTILFFGIHGSGRAQKNREGLGAVPTYKYHHQALQR